MIKRKDLNIIPADILDVNLDETPKRFKRYFKEITAGNKLNPEEILAKTFPNDCWDADRPENSQMVIIKDIDFASTCAHHIVPFIGKAHIGYIPRERVVGISKFVRLLEAYSKRLQIQERLTFQVAEDIDRILKPQGVMVVIEAQHLCMKVRGVKNATAKTVTSAVRGIFNTSASVRAEFLELIRA